MKKQPKLKFVKRANCWCVTYWEVDKIKQKWFVEKERAEDFINKINNNKYEKTNNNNI